MRLPRAFAALIALSISLLLSLSMVAGASAYEWVIEEEELAGLGSGKEKTATSGGAFTLSVAGIKLNIKCTSETGTGEITEGGKGTFSLTLKSCSVEGTKCTVEGEGKIEGTLTISGTRNVFAKEVSKTVKFYEEFSPKTIIYFLGAKCTLAEEVELSGTTAAEVPKSFEESSSRAIKFSGEIASEAGKTGLLYGKESATLTGEASEHMSGAHESQLIGVAPYTVRPLPIAVPGAGPAMRATVTIKNVSNVNNIVLKDIKILAGPYTLVEPMVPCKTQTLTPGNSCVTKVECPVKPSANGTFFAEIEERTPGNVLVGSGKSKSLITC